MRLRVAGCAVPTAIALALAPGCSVGMEPDTFDARERAAILAHGPWPQPMPADPSNRLVADPAARACGERLFAEPRLSVDARVSCADCHDPARAFQDGRRTGLGVAAGTRNTIALLDAGNGRWFGWDGASDSLWAASLRPMLAAHEMGMTVDGVADALAALLRDDATVAARCAAVLGGERGPRGEAMAVRAAKALAAYQATLVSPRTPFDDFRDALARGDPEAMARYPAAARRGLRLFLGEGRCASCHAGPRFTNGEFADIGRPFFLPGGGADAGRHAGIRALRANPMNRLGPHADDGGASAVATRHVTLEPRHFGEFKVPTLRSLVHTAPYFHDGSAATLADVVQHYSRFDPERLHADGQRLLRPLHLTPSQAADLEAFLRSLSH